MRFEKRSIKKDKCKRSATIEEYNELIIKLKILLYYTMGRIPKRSFTSYIKAHLKYLNTMDRIKIFIFYNKLIKK